VGWSTVFAARAASVELEKLKPKMDFENSGKLEFLSNLMIIGVSESCGEQLPGAPIHF